MRVRTLDEEEPQKGYVDRALQTQAQEGTGGRNYQKKDAKDSEIPEGYCRCFFERHPGQEKPEARG